MTNVPPGARSLDLLCVACNLATKGTGESPFTVPNLGWSQRLPKYPVVCAREAFTL